MTVAILDGPAVLKFVQDGDAFNKYVDEHFMVLDVDGDGVLSYAELQKEFNFTLIGFESGTKEDEVSGFYQVIFDKFDYDKNGSIDVEEFRSGMKDVMLAVAQGIGDLPIQVSLAQGSFLMKAFEYDTGNKAEE